MSSAHSTSQAVNAPVVCLMGPTASGKTALAIELVQKFPMDVISVDSALVYRGLNIGAAKPSAAEQQLAPHRLVDICDPAAPYSAGQFRNDCLKHIAEIHAAGRVPLLVGGTMMYFKALEQMDDLPQTDKALRQKLKQQLEESGLASLVAELQRLDPKGAKQVELANPQRVMRAVEMVTLSGQSLTELWGRQQRLPVLTNVLKIALIPEREVLHQRIALRLQQMFANGFVEEVKGLYARGDLNIDMPAIRAVGYRQVWQALAGEYELDKAQELALYATRQLAKRQLTWLRKEPNAQTFDPLASDSHHLIAEAISGFIQKANI